MAAMAGSGTSMGCLALRREARPREARPGSSTEDLILDKAMGVDSEIKGTPTSEAGHTAGILPQSRAKEGSAVQDFLHWKWAIAGRPLISLASGYAIIGSALQATVCILATATPTLFARSCMGSGRTG